MRRFSRFPGRCLSPPLALLVSSALIAAVPGTAADRNQFPTWRLEARVVVVGLPGVAGVRQVGRFHTGGPIPGNPDFLLSTGSGQVLDPERVLVAVASNFGAPLGEKTQAAGSVLSIDPRGDPSGGPLIVPDDLAASGGQSKAAGGAIILYTAQTDEFQNRRYNSRARTAGYTAASAPRYLSINNAFGRPWIANAPNGLHGEALPGRNGEVPLYSDLLLHDMGLALDDKIVQGTAIGSEWRTTPLIGLGLRHRYLHDGRAVSLRDAILAHGGEAQIVRDRFFNLDDADRQAILSFLGTL